MWARNPALALGLTLLTVATAVAQSGDPDGGQRQRPRPDDGFARVDRVQFDISAASGGDVYLWAPGEFAALAPVPIPVEREALLLAYGELAQGARELEVPVDATVGQVSFFMSLQGKERLELIDPTGKPLTLGPGVTLTETRHMLVATLRSPRKGTWRLGLAGRGLYSISARASGRPGAPASANRIIELLEVGFVEAGGRPGHEGLFPVHSTPPAGAAAQARVRFAGKATDLALTLVDASGEPIDQCQPVSAGAEASAPATDDVLFDCRIPTQPYRFAVSGLDPERLPFQRVQAALVMPGPELTGR